MKEVLDDIERWRRPGSASRSPRRGDRGVEPRDPGATWPSATGRGRRSVSGGCVEGAVVQEALAILAGEKERGIVTFGYSDDDAFAVGSRAAERSPVRGALTGEQYTELRDGCAPPNRSRSRPSSKARIWAKLLVRPMAGSSGTLGDAKLDRVVGRDAQASSRRDSPPPAIRRARGGA